MKEKTRFLLILGLLMAVSLFFVIKDVPGLINRPAPAAAPTRQPAPSGQLLTAIATLLPEDGLAWNDCANGIVYPSHPPKCLTTQGLRLMQTPGARGIPAWPATPPAPYPTP